MAYAERRNTKLTGRWICDAEYRHADGSTTRWHKAFPSKGEAEGAEAYYRATGQQPPHLIAAPTLDFKSAAHEFAREHKDWCNATNLGRLDFAIDHLGKVDIAALRMPELRQYRDKVLAQAGHNGKDPANRTVNYYLDAVSKVLRFAHANEWIASVPAIPRLPNTGHSRGIISWAVEDAICAHLLDLGRDDCAFVVRVLAATGMRAGELQAIRPEQVETPEQRENCGVLLAKEQTKTNITRWVPIVPAGAAELRARLASGAVPTHYSLYGMFKRAVRSLGEPESTCIHSLRHTTATRLKETGAQDLDVAVILGHTTGLMTQRYYHPNKPHLFSVAEKVQIRLGETAPTREVVPLFPQHKSA